MGLGVLFPLSFAALLLVAGVESTNFTIRNNCAYTIWPATQTNSGQQPSSSSFELESNASSTIIILSPWNGRFTARTFSTAGISFTCKLLTRSQIACTGISGTMPLSLVEISIGSVAGNDFYDISLVDGFNIPVSVAPQQGSCQPISCSADINAQCPRELAVRDTNGATVGCKSACMAFEQPQYCCAGDFGSRDTCKPSNYTTFFKGWCPQTYSLALDEVLGTYTCPTGASYFITFCP